MDLLKTKKAKIISLILAGLGLILFVGAILVFRGLPGEEEIRQYRIPSTVESFHDFDWNNPPDGPIRKWVPATAISDYLRDAVVISEDDLFWSHDGVNFTMMKEAFKVNWERKRYARGASTITMQLARNAFLTKEKSLLRKIREIIVARRIESVLSKARILELYLNLIEWGEDVYGAEAAAHYYFAKPARDLNLAEASTMAAILPNPIRFNPFTRPETVKTFQKRVLSLMALSRVIEHETAQAAFEAPVRLRGQQQIQWASGDTLSEPSSQEIEAFVDFRGDDMTPTYDTPLDTVAVTTIENTPSDSLHLQTPSADSVAHPNSPL